MKAAVPRNLPPVGGHAALARHLGQSLMADEFDMSFFQDKALDHGCFSPLSMLWDHQDGWPGQIVPLQVGVLQFPVPSARRCYKLGQGLRRAIESYPEDLNVVLVATGGLSHQVHGERAGFNNTPWDHQFLDLFENDPETLLNMTHAELPAWAAGKRRSGDVDGDARAMSDKLNCLHREYYLPSMTGIAVAVYEPACRPMQVLQAAAMASPRPHGPAAKGIEQLQGTYPFTLETANARYRINRYLYQLIQPAFRERFLADPEATYDAAGLSQEECDLISRRDWRGMIRTA
jgi:gallate dioxygenase